MFDCKTKKRSLVFVAGSNYLAIWIRYKAAAAEVPYIPLIAASHIDTIIVASGRNVFGPDFKAFTGCAWNCMWCKDNLCTTQCKRLRDFGKMSFYTKLDSDSKAAG